SPPRLIRNARRTTIEAGSVRASLKQKFTPHGLFLCQPLDSPLARWYTLTCQFNVKTKKENDRDGGYSQRCRPSRGCFAHHGLLCAHQPKGCPDQPGEAPASVGGRRRAELPPQCV